MHRQDIQSRLIKLLCNTREPTDRPEIIVAESLGINKLSDVILSRKRLPYLDKLCEANGVVGHISDQGRSGQQEGQHSGRWIA